jgi:hypothetical protein
MSLSNIDTVSYLSMQLFHYWLTNFLRMKFMTWLCRSLEVLPQLAKALPQHAVRNGDHIDDAVVVSGRFSTPLYLSLVHMQPITKTSESHLQPARMERLLATSYYPLILCGLQ